MIRALDRWSLDPKLVFAIGGLTLFMLLVGCDLVMGNRFRGGIEPGAMPPLHRYLGNPVLSAVGRLFFKSPCGDFHCGLRGFRRDAILALGLQTTGMEFASEMVVKATLMGLRIAEVPTTLSPDGRSRPPHLRSWRDGWRHLRFLLLASPNYLFTIPGMVLTIAGIITLALSLPSDTIEIGDVSWQPIFAGPIMVAVGVNALLLGFASRLYTTERGLTNEDAVLRFYHRYLGLETFVAIGILLALTGVGLDLVIAFAEFESVSTLTLAAIAQTLILVGANIFLVGFVASLLEPDR